MAAGFGRGRKRGKMGKRPTTEARRAMRHMKRGGMARGSHRRSANAGR